MRREAFAEDFEVGRILQLAVLLCIMYVLIYPDDKVSYCSASDSAVAVQAIFDSKARHIELAK